MSVASLNGFSVGIRSTANKSLWPVTKQADGSFVSAVPHESTYGITLNNERDVACDAKMSIDGLAVGTFRLEPFQSWTIERPEKNDKAFVFVREQSKEATEGSVTTGKSENGLITVIFEPALPVRTKRCRAPSNHTSRGVNKVTKMGITLESCTKVARGATVMGQATGQEFHDAGPLGEIDVANRTTIHVRLVVDTEAITVPYTSLAAAAAGFATPVPPPV